MEAIIRRSKESTIQHDPGGKVKLALAPDVKGAARFSPCNRYRYTLHRVWDKALPCAMFVLMNPSTAEYNVDDPTVAKAQRYARSWGYGSAIVVNTFAYRATDQKRLLEIEDPIGPENDRWISHYAKTANIIVFAYGKPHKKLRQRGPTVAHMLCEKGHGHKLYALELALDGTPKHPLYLKGSLQPIKLPSLT